MVERATQRTGGEMRKAISVALLTMATACATAGGRTGDWSVTMSKDPVTGIERCVVAVFDGSDNFQYSKLGSLYAFVERNSALGVLVGVSSGGPYRVPPGDILWRVDDLPFRELKMMNTPALPTAAAKSTPITAPAALQGNPEVEKAIRDAMAATTSILAASASGVTAASGDEARAIIAEMKAGESLIFRGATAAPSMGLASSATAQVGMNEGGQLRPIRLDASFRSGLVECNID